MTNLPKHRLILPLTGALCLASVARADVVSDWNTTAAEITASAELPPPAAYRVMALVQTAVLEAVQAVTGHSGATLIELEPAPGAALDAAVAAANRAVLVRLLPAQEAAIERAFGQAVARVSEGDAKRDGLAVGERAAAAVLALRSEDGAGAEPAYRPVTTPGVYVPTSLPVLPQWPGRKPWHLARADQFRPAPPPALESELWARDLNEIRALGARNGSTRTSEQTQIARFWEATAPAIYFTLLQSITRQPGRDVTQNARLFAIAAQALDDALIATFEAKYHYGFWRPLTAIRNADRDQNQATERDAAWLPLIETPMHPEYPAAHCALAGALGAVLRAEVGAGPLPTLSSVSPKLPGVTRSWSSIDDFVREVADARIYDGVHYRNSTIVGSELGRQVGELASARAAGVSSRVQRDSSARPSGAR